MILACHNRRALTVRGISAFARAAKLAGVDADYSVFDDGSTDGTAEALAALHMPITRIAGDGSAYWSHSMSVAEAHALRTYDDGYLVWLNDDVELDEDAIEVALAAIHRAPAAVLLGAMREPATGRITYAGQRRRGIFPLDFVNVAPNGTLRPIENMCGNFVLVPIALARRLGGIDGGFPHGFADWDYGVRVHDAGFELLLLPRVVGSCAANPGRPRGSVVDDWRAFLGVKSEGNYTAMKRILRKWHPHIWVGYMVLIYLRWWCRRLRSTLLRSALGIPQHV